MQSVPLFPTKPLADVQKVIGVPVSDDCSSCSLAGNRLDGIKCARPRIANRHVESDDVILVVLGSPPRNPASNDQTARWVYNFLTAKLRERKYVVDYALRCPTYNAVKQTTIVDGHTTSCRPYLARTFNSVQPSRVILLGGLAAKGFLGNDRGSAVHCNRNGYAWITDARGVDVPVFMLKEPYMVRDNSFEREHFERDFTTALTRVPPKPDYGAVALDLAPTQEDADFVAALASTATRVTLDTETYGTMWTPDFRILSACLVFDTMPSTPVVWFEDALVDGTPTRSVFDAVMQNPGIRKGGHNMYFDVGAIRSALGYYVDVHSDSMLAYRLLNSSGLGALDNLSELIGYGGHKDEARRYVDSAEEKLRAFFKARLEGSTANVAAEAKRRAPKYAYASLPRDVNVRYVARDALVSDKLISRLERRLSDGYTDSIAVAYTDSLVPATSAFVRIQENGVPYDHSQLETVRTYILSELDAIKLRIEQSGAREVDIDSNMELGKYLFSSAGLGLSPRKATRAGAASVDADVLKSLAGEHPLVLDILAYREMKKLLSTYINTLPYKVYPDGRIRPYFRLDGTETGRLSATDGFHQIPSRSKVGKKIKSIFRPPRGRCIIQADYSTLEIRVAAILSDDDAMKRILLSGVDFHLETARLLGPRVWGVSSDEISRRHDGGDTSYRTICKTINFATLYGQSARELGVRITSLLRSSGLMGSTQVFSEAEAEGAQKAIFGEFPRLSAWIRDQQRFVRENGFVWTWWDGNKMRRRALYDVGSVRSSDAGSALRSSFNTPVQGTASEFCLRSVIKLERDCRDIFGRKCFPILTVHDSVLFEADLRRDVLTPAVQLIYGVMTGWPSNGVPLPVDIEVGFPWSDLKPVTINQNGDVVLPDLEGLL